MAKQIVFNPDEWGGCPRCHHNDGGLISGDMRQWFWCKRHKFKWQTGLNLVSAAQQMPRWALQRQARLLAQCHEVKPWFRNRRMIFERENV
jgi:hypothetical protein